jgi:hypothetical protein
MHGLVARPEEFSHVDILRTDFAAEPALAAGRDEPGRHRSVAVEGAGVTVIWTSSAMRPGNFLK